MTSTLLEQFLAEECTSYVRGLLEEALLPSASPSKRFEFNRFEILVNHVEGVVLVEDVLDATDGGTLRVPLLEFVAALNGPAR